MKDKKGSSVLSDIFCKQQWLSSQVRHCELFLLLLLRSPATSLGFTILGDIFVYVTFFIPTIEVVTFCLRGVNYFTSGSFSEAGGHRVGFHGT